MRSMEWKPLTGKTLHGSICLWLVMNKSSVSCTQRSTYSQILYCVLERWTKTLSQILHGKTDWRGSKVHQNTEFWKNWWWANGIRVECFPRIHHIAVQPQSPRVIVMIERNTREVYWTHHLYVQQHLMGIYGQQERMRGKCSTRLSHNAKRFGAGQWSFLGLGSEKRWYSISADSPQGEWDKIAELMMLKFGESGHQVFSIYESIVQRSAWEQRCWKIDDTLLRRLSKRLKLFFAQLFQLITSVFAVQSQKRVKNMNLVTK